MRTTVTLDDDLARLLSDRQHRERKTFKQVLNEALRAGLAVAPVEPETYRHRTHRSGVRPGFDITALNRLADELEDEETTAGGSA